MPKKKAPSKKKKKAAKKQSANKKRKQPAAPDNPSRSSPRQFAESSLEQRAPEIEKKFLAARSEREQQADRASFRKLVAANDPPLRLSIALPASYPPILKFHAELALREANTKGYTRRYLVEACRVLLVDQLNPYVYEAVKVGAIHPVTAMEAVRVVIGQVIHENCENDQEREAAQRQVLDSYEWLKLMRSIEDALLDRAQVIAQTPKPEVTPLAPHVHSDPKTEETAKTADELSYDRDTQILKFREMVFPGTSEIQFKAIKYLYDAAMEGSAGVSTKALKTAIGKVRLGNLFQRKGLPLKKALIAWDPHSKLYRFKPPLNKPRPN